MSRFVPHQFHLGYWLLFPGVLFFTTQDPEWPFWVRLIMTVVGWIFLAEALAVTEKIAYQYGKVGGIPRQWGVAVVSRTDASWRDVKPMPDLTEANTYRDAFNEAASKGMLIDEFAILIRRNRRGKWKAVTDDD
ncbi:membrane protein [Microbacterium phage Pumpernickel]|uniref:Membrane protein n=1 Tax=Microbacterium phage Pumpernickel TaxID=2885983 RepID=A0AAE8Y7L7_9CAUD|nr:membrane protein [Microbacterium phage Pumpernickel]UDL15985.1 membrane protein [Microbacterium phage Pumpernickel]